MFYRQMKAQERLKQIYTLQLEIIKMRDNLQQARTTCKYPQYIHDAAKKYQELFNQILGFVDKIVQVGNSY